MDARGLQEREGETLRFSHDETTRREDEAIPLHIALGGCCKLGLNELDDLVRPHP